MKFINSQFWTQLDLICKHKLNKLDRKKIYCGKYLIFVCVAKQTKHTVRTIQPLFVSVEKKHQQLLRNIYIEWCVSDLSRSLRTLNRNIQTKDSFVIYSAEMQQTFKWIFSHFFRFDWNSALWSACFGSHQQHLTQFKFCVKSNKTHDRSSAELNFCLRH